MRLRFLGCATLLLAGAMLWFNISETGGVSMAEEKGDAKKLAHNVFFTLKEDTPQNRQRLVDACYKYLKDHPGVVYFGAGTLVEELDRPVNDRAFQVGLHVVFDSRQSHDRYQTAETHLKFIEENKSTWEKVRVFDTYVR